MSEYIAQKDSPAEEDFSVTDSAGDLVASIPVGQFTSELFDPTGTASGLTVTFTELGGGHYRATYTPNAAGTWYLIVKHPTYFPAGKAGTQQVFEGDLDAIFSSVEKVRKIESNRVVISPDGLTITVYEDDGTTVAFSLSLDASRCERNPI